MKAYDLESVEELVAFDLDCVAASKHCPQSTDTPITSWASSGISSAWVFALWFDNSTLWGSGYSEYLSARAKQTFGRYAMLRNGDVHDTATHKTLYQVDTFRIKRTVTKE